MASLAVGNLTGEFRTMRNDIASNEVVGVSNGIEGALSAPIYGYEVMFEECHVRAVRNDMLGKVKNNRRKIRQDPGSRQNRRNQIASELRKEAKAKAKKERLLALKSLRQEAKELNRLLAHPEVAGTPFEEMVRQDIASNMAKQMGLSKAKK